MKTLKELFLDELADTYDAENRLTKALPKMAKAATHDELRAAIESHLEETEGQVKKLERVFEAFGERAKGKKCLAMEGLIKEGDELAGDHKGEPTINAALISAAQKVEHYEIASYGCLREWAEQLGNQDAAELLGEIMEEEKSADRKLTELARECCNAAAESGADETEGESEAGQEKGSGRMRLASRRIRAA
jgi:ferritin-like metal-binding protein YciE